MEPSGYQLRNVSTKQSSAPTAMRPQPTARVARRARENELRNASSSPSNYRENRHVLRSPSIDEIIITRTQSLRTPEDIARSRAAGREERNNGHRWNQSTSEVLHRSRASSESSRLSRATSETSQSDMSSISDSTASNENAHHGPEPFTFRRRRAPSVYSDIEDPLESEIQDPRFSGISPAARPEQPAIPRLALFSRPDRGLLGGPTSETSVNSTISRDNTAGEQARHASLFAEYGRKLMPKGQRDTRLPRARPSPSLAPRNGSGISNDLPADQFQQSSTQSYEVNRSARSNVSNFEELAITSSQDRSTRDERIDMAREYIRLSRQHGPAQLGVSRRLPSPVARTLTQRQLPDPVSRSQGSARRRVPG